MIYTQNLILVGLAALFAGVGWRALCEQYREKKAFRLLCLLLSCVAIGAILHYTVLGREISDQHIFTFLAQKNDEFFREMFMNALLYFPLGLWATTLLDGWSVLFAFALSFAIETFQYFSGAGIAQGTDVLMNTLGALLGALFLCPRARKRS